MTDPNVLKERLMTEARAMADRSETRDAETLAQLGQSLMVQVRDGKHEASCTLAGRPVVIVFSERQLDPLNARRLILTLTKIAGAPISDFLIEAPQARGEDPWVGIVILVASLIAGAVFWESPVSIAVLLCLSNLAAGCLVSWRGMKWAEVGALALTSSVSALWDPAVAGIYFFVALIFVNLSAKMNSEALSRGKWIAFHTLLALGAALFRPDLTRFSAPIEKLSLGLRGAAMASTFLIASGYWFAATPRGPLHFRVCVSLFIFCLLAPHSSLLYMATLLIALAPLMIRQILPR